MSYRDLVAAAAAAGQTLVVIDGILRQLSWAEGAAIEAMDAALNGRRRGQRVSASSPFS